MTCLETFATLRVFSESLGPDTIQRILDIESTNQIPRDETSRYRPRRETNYWSWCTQGKIETTDNLAHVGAILDLLKDKESQLRSLRERGCQIDICNYYVFYHQGGPELDLATLQALSHLELPISWDIYAGDQDEI